jgi:hypothetical protein
MFFYEAQSEINRQIAKGKRSALYFLCSFGNDPGFRNLEKMALHPSGLLPFAICLLPFDFKFSFACLAVLIRFQPPYKSARPPGLVLVLLPR